MVVQDAYLLRKHGAVISQDDAHAFCLVAAQVIPTLLIAHFVAERTLPPGPAPKWKQALPKPAQEQKEVREGIDEARTQVARRRERLEALDPSNMSEAGIDAYNQERDAVDNSAAALETASTQLEAIERSQNELGGYLTRHSSICGTRICRSGYFSMD